MVKEARFYNFRSFILEEVHSNIVLKLVLLKEAIKKARIQGVNY